MPQMDEPFSPLHFTPSIAIAMDSFNIYYTETMEAFHSQPSQPSQLPQTATEPDATVKSVRSRLINDNQHPVHHTSMHYLFLQGPNAPAAATSSPQLTEPALHRGSPARRGWVTRIQRTRAITVPTGLPSWLQGRFWHDDESGTAGAHVLAQEEIVRTHHNHNRAKSTSILVRSAKTAPPVRPSSGWFWAPGSSSPEDRALHNRRQAEKIADALRGGGGGGGGEAGENMPEGQFSSVSCARRDKQAEIGDPGDKWLMDRRERDKTREDNMAQDQVQKNSQNPALVATEDHQKQSNAAAKGRGQQMLERRKKDDKAQMWFPNFH